MANSLFDPGREGFLSGQIVWTSTPTLKASLVRGYTFSAAHKFVADVTGASGTLVATAALTTPTYTNGVANADNTTFTAVPTGAAITGILVYMSSAVGGGSDVADSAKRLIAWIDTATGLPVTPNSGDITIAWDSGSLHIFKL